MPTPNPNPKDKTMYIYWTRRPPTGLYEMDTTTLYDTHGPMCNCSPCSDRNREAAEIDMAHGMEFEPDTHWEMARRCIIMNGIDEIANHYEATFGWSGDPLEHEEAEEDALWDYMQAHIDEDWLFDDLVFEFTAGSQDE